MGATEGRGDLRDLTELVIVWAEAVSPKLRTVGLINNDSSNLLADEAALEHGKEFRVYYKLGTYSNDAVLGLCDVLQQRIPAMKK